MNSWSVALFHTTSAALRSERILKRAGLTVKLIPTPRELSSECGLALRFSPHHADEVEALLKDAGIDTAGIYAI